MIEECGVVILAGGKSARMGRPKALLDFAGVPLLARIIARLRHQFSEFVVVAAPGQELPVVQAIHAHDEQPGEGPVGGLVVGLRALDRPLAFVVSCDVPFVSLMVARHLAEAATGYDAAVPEWDGRLHPLQAVYRTSVQPLLEELFRQGHRRPVALFERVRTRTVPESELRPLDPEGLSFLNVNTPEDYAHALTFLPETP